MSVLVVLLLPLLLLGFLGPVIAGVYLAVRLNRRRPLQDRLPEADAGRLS